MNVEIPAMSPEELREAMAVLRWTPHDFSEETSIRMTTIRRWRLGEMPVPGPVAAWLRELVAFHRAHPSPRRPPRDPENPDRGNDD